MTDRLQQAKEHVVRAVAKDVFKQQNFWVHPHRWRGFICTDIQTFTAHQITELQERVGANYIITGIATGAGNIQLQCLPVAPPPNANENNTPKPHRCKVGAIYHTTHTRYTVEIVAHAGYSDSYSHGNKVYPIYEVRNLGKYGNYMAKGSQRTRLMAECYIKDLFTPPTKLRKLRSQKFSHL